MITVNKCAFIGHRKINITNVLKIALKNLIEELIINKNVTTFLFGTKSQFNNLCYEIVTELKDKYKNIKRIVYSCKNECCLLETDKEKYNSFLHSIISINKCYYFDEEISPHELFKAGKASYIERNKIMIDNSNYCIFYFDYNYVLNNVPYSNFENKRKNSGTKLAYEYAIKKNKVVYNLANKL